MFILYITSRYSHFNILFSKPCHRQYELLPSLGVCHPFTFHILIFSSENHQPIELKIGRKHLWKVFSKQCIFGYDPLSNMAATGNSCFWWADFFSSLGHRPCELLSWVVVHPSVSFSHLNLLLWNHWTELNQTCQKCSLDGPLPDLCFWCWSEIQHGCQGP